MQKGRRTKEYYRLFTLNRVTTLAGTLVFFLIMSLVPFLFWLTLLFGGRIDGALPDLFGWANDLVAFLAENAEGATAGASVLFLATTLFSSTGFFYHLKRSGEIIYGAKEAHSGWKVRLHAIGLTFLILLYLAFAGGVMIGANLLTDDLPPALRYLCVYSLLFVFAFFAVWILNGYVCPFRVSPGKTALGSFITTVLLLAASFLFVVYLSLTSREKLYGALSLIVVFLLYLYWMMICFTYGIVLNKRFMGIE